LQNLNYKLHYIFIFNYGFINLIVFFYKHDIITSGQYNFQEGKETW